MMHQTDKRHFVKYMTALCSLGLIATAAGCAGETFSYNPDDGFQTIPREQDAADNIEKVDCSTAFDKDRDTYLSPFTGSLVDDGRYTEGYFGYIDDKCHRRSAKYVNAPDTDYIRFEAEPGTPMNIYVSRADSGGKTNPVAYLIDERGNELIYSHCAGAYSTELWFIAPSKTFYVSVEDENNYNFNPLETCTDGQTFKGGSKYAYVVIARENTKKMVHTFGDISSPQEWTSGFSQDTGESFYFKARPENGRSLEVRLRGSNNLPGTHPVITPIDRTDDNYVWSYSGTKLSETYHASKNEASVIVSNKLADSEGYLWFAITDYKSETNYTFVITVSPVD